MSKLDQIRPDRFVKVYILSFALTLFLFWIDSQSILVSLQPFLVVSAEQMIECWCLALPRIVVLPFLDEPCFVLAHMSNTQRLIIIDIKGWLGGHQITYRKSIDCMISKFFKRLMKYSSIIYLSKSSFPATQLSDC